MTRCHWIWTSFAILFASASAQAQGTLAQWGYAAFGSSVGRSGIVVATGGGETEIYVGGSIGAGGDTHRWLALRYDSATRQFEQVYVSDHLPQTIVRIAPARVTGYPPLIAVALGDGVLRFYHRQTKALLATYWGYCAYRGGLRAFAVADLDGDASDEFISMCADRTLVADGAHYTPWSLSGFDGIDIAVGQMDDDPALEIATSDGQIVDSVTRAVEYHLGGGYIFRLQAVDIDADGRDELVMGEDFSSLIAYDVETQNLKWSISTGREVSAFLVADIDGDGALELLTGEAGEQGFIRAYDIASLANLPIVEWSMQSPGFGITRIAAVDVDGDGRNELLWGTGATAHRGPSNLYVADWQSRAIVWQNQHLDGPFVGPQIGDLDGDGVPEVVVATLTSDFGRGGGRIIVFDSRTGKVRAISPGVAGGTNGWIGVRDLKLRDLDGDGRPEIVVAADWQQDGLVEAYRFSAPDTFTLVWTNATRPAGAPFHSVEVADLDGDGIPEVIAGVDGEFPGNAGALIFVYDFATGAEKGRTPLFGGFDSTVANLAIADTDGDGAVELLGLLAGGDVHVFSGTDLSLEAIIETQGASLTTHNPGTGIQLLIGEMSGRMSVRQFDGTGYAEISSAVLGTAPLDGLHVAPGGALWVGSGGTLRRFAGEEMTFESANYGDGLGRGIVFFPESNWVVSAGGYGVHGFRTAP